MLPRNSLVPLGMLTMVHMLRVPGTARRSLEEKIDTSFAARELVFLVFGSLRHFERRLVSERTRDGSVAAQGYDRAFRS